MIRIPDDDELEDMSEHEIDVLFDRLMREHSAGLDAMTPRQLYQYRRRTRLDLCLRQRKMIRTSWLAEFFRPRLKATQRRLLEARIEYRTGAIPGHS
jgi:hypothetical protein